MQIIASLLLLHLAGLPTVTRAMAVLESPSENLENENRTVAVQ